MCAFFRRACALVALFVIPSLSSLAKESDMTRVSSVYNDLVRQGNVLSNPKQTMRDLEEDSSAFASYPFVLWDYAEDIASGNTQSAITHWTNLLQFISENTITRVITDIKDPSHFPFFGVSAEEPSFMSYAAKLPDSCELAVLFELSGFAWDSSPSPVPNPAALPSPYPALPSYFADLPLKMEWVRQMIGLGIPIKEVVLDPQPADSQGSTADYQLLIDYMDYFCTVNNLDVHLAVTFGVNVKEPTYSNLSTFPTPSSLAPPGYFPPIATGYTAPEWRPSSTSPLLTHVYIQVYEPDMPYIFTLPNNPVLAAASLLHNFRDEPYIQGTGTLTFSSTSKAVTGTNTAFTTGTPPVVEDMPLGVMQSGDILRIGIVSEDVPVTETTLSFNSNPPISGTNQPFYQTEIINKWTFPYTTPEIVDGIVLLFSFENQVNNEDPFFGTWTTDQFMSFLQSFYSQGQSDTLPIYYQDGSTGISLPANFGIYDFNIFQENVGE